MWFPRIRLTLPDTYEIPKLLQYWPLAWWTAFCLMWGLILISAHYGWMDPQTVQASLQQWAIYGLGATVAFGLFWLRHWLIEARYYVLAVEWSGEEIVVHTRRGRPCRIKWASVTQAKVPPDPGDRVRGTNAAYWHAVRLFVSDQRTPYRIPLTWDSSCKHFLSVLPSRVTVVEVEEKQ